MKINNKSGFTLIEIIVVLIIVGILAAIALPNLFSNISKSRSEEALANMSSFRPAVETCIIANLTTDLVKCSNNAATGLGSPSSTANFTYVYTGPAANNSYQYTIAATGQGALGPTDTITLTRGATAASVVSCAAGAGLLGAC